MKYGKGLSLLVMAGTLAIDDMGGPVLGFTASCIDHVNKYSNHRTEDHEQFQLITEQMNSIVPSPLGQIRLNI